MPFPTGIFYTFLPAKGSQPSIGGDDRSDLSRLGRSFKDATAVPNQNNRNALPADGTPNDDATRDRVGCYESRKNRDWQEKTLEESRRARVTLAVRYTTECQHADLAREGRTACGMSRPGSRPRRRDRRPQHQQRTDVTNNDSGKTKIAFPRLLFLRYEEPHQRHFIALPRPTGGTQGQDRPSCSSDSENGEYEQTPGGRYKQERRFTFLVGV
jgi:hypothetical protein